MIVGRVVPVRACLALVAACGAPVPVGLSADTVYVNGVVVTMDAGARTVAAVAVRGDEIVAVGSTDEVLALAGPSTETVDLPGRTMVPGLYAAHDHFPGSGRVAVSSVDLNSPPVGSIETMDELVTALAAKGYTGYFTEPYYTPFKGDADYRGYPRRAART